MNITFILKFLRIGNFSWYLIHFASTDFSLSIIFIYLCTYKIKRVHQLERLKRVLVDLDGGDKGCIKETTGNVKLQIYFNETNLR